MILISNIKRKSNTPEEIEIEFDQLDDKINEIYFKAPITSKLAVKKAAKALKKKKDNTYSDEEINSFLPEKLRKLEKTGEQNE